VLKVKLYYNFELFDKACIFDLYSDVFLRSSQKPFPMAVTGRKAFSTEVLNLISKSVPFEMDSLLTDEYFLFKKIDDCFCYVVSTLPNQYFNFDLHKLVNIHDRLHHKQQTIRKKEP